jgi:hypothetical protein
MPEATDNLSDDFTKAMEAWRQKHKVRDGDPLLFCLELFRIHQDHWDAIRRKEMPSFAEFRDSLLALKQQANAIQRHEASLLEEMAHYPKPSRFVAPSITGLLLTALFAAITGILIGKYLL